MTGELIRLITAPDGEQRNRPLDSFCRAAPFEALMAECDALDQFRRNSENLYERVRALFFLYAIHRFHVPAKLASGLPALIPFAGYQHLLRRRFGEAIDTFLAVQHHQGPSDAISSALAASYHGLGFQTLANQVRRSVRSVRGNQWMFRTGHPADYPLRVRRELTEFTGGALPILHESTPVRMDLSHSGWSDIFFLGMDFPEGARVFNISIDLAVRGTAAAAPRPPVEAYFRVIDQPVLRLVSVDLEAVAEITSLAEVFDFARDYLGLLKAAVIASGIVPAGMEGSQQPLAALLARLVGRSGYGIELVSQVNDIPKGSRLAVSTNLLACLIAVAMRATGQARNLSGQLQENERRLVAARAILGEWLGGSGGGWQDSGGVWPGMKRIEGVAASEGDPEYGISRGRLLPNHSVLGEQDIPARTRRKLEDCLVLVHGGMAQDVGPILEMVTERYLLRSESEWAARNEAIRIFDELVAALAAGDLETVGRLTDRNFHGPISAIIPWASNVYTETIVGHVRREFGGDFWGFWMLGGMSGGGMGFIFHPRSKPRAQERLREIMRDAKRQMERAVPFAMDPVVYDFAINERGTHADMLAGASALMPASYYTLTLPETLRQDLRTLTPGQRAELERFGAVCHQSPGDSGMIQALFERMLPRAVASDGDPNRNLESLVRDLGFDAVQHEQIRSDLRSGRIGLAQNRLPVSSRIEDARPRDVVDLTNPAERDYVEGGESALARGEVAVVTLAGGVGSRWTKGAGVVKALHPFCRLGGSYRSFIEVHLAKSRRASHCWGVPVQHVITTSYLTDQSIRNDLAARNNYGFLGPLHVSPGRIVGLRLIPMMRDLRFAWEEMPQQLLDEQAQKVRDSLRIALLGWAQQMGEGGDYTDNVPLQCLHPVGHWYEVPNLLLNGVLRQLLEERPVLRHLMVHNIDTLGADLSAAVLGCHRIHGAMLTTEVIPRRIEDRGGGLARVDGQLRLVEGLALPREEIEFGLSYYNSSTTWVDIDRLLEMFGLGRDDLHDAPRVADAVRAAAARMPTYITIKDVKKRWGRGQEDVYPVCQFEKLWGDMTALPEASCRFAVVPRQRGQQLKDVSQLDGWLRDGSATYVESLCDWG